MMMSKDEIRRMLQTQAALARQIHASPGGPQKWVGRVIKKGFPPSQPGDIGEEWMFVEITGVEGGKLVGVLLNHPRFATHLGRGDSVVLDEAEITLAAE